MILSPLHLFQILNLLLLLSRLRAWLRFLSKMLRDTAQLYRGFQIGKIKKQPANLLQKNFRFSTICYFYKGDQNIGYRCERMVEDEIECRKIIYEQYEENLISVVEEQIRKEVITRSKDNKCLISSPTAVIWGSSKEGVTPK